MKILLTGGGGFIGTEFLRQAKGAGHEVQQFIGDVRDMEATRRIWWKGVDALVHLAAAGVKFTATDRTWVDCMRVNLVGALNLLDSITLSKCTPVVFIPGSVREAETFSVPHLWRDPYVVSKIVAAHAIREWSNLYPGRVFRPLLGRCNDQSDAGKIAAEILKAIA